MPENFLIKFDSLTGERLSTIPYDDDVTPVKAQEMLNSGYELVPCEEWQKLIGNYDGQEYVKDVVNGSGYVVKPPYKPTLEETKEEKLTALQKLLTDTDYKAIKYAEGALTEDEYMPIRLSRQQWREAYNAIESATTLEEINTVAGELK